jgi:hypothetical protein
MLDVFQHGLLLGTHLGFFAFGWVFFYRKLFKDFEVRRLLLERSRIPATLPAR